MDQSLLGNPWRFLYATSWGAPLLRYQEAYLGALSPKELLCHAWRNCCLRPVLLQPEKTTIVQRRFLWLAIVGFQDSLHFSLPTYVPPPCRTSTACLETNVVANRLPNKGLRSTSTNTWIPDKTYKGLWGTADKWFAWKRRSWNWYILVMIWRLSLSGLETQTCVVNGIARIFFTAQTRIQAYSQGWDLARMDWVPLKRSSDSKLPNRLLHGRTHTSMLPKPNTGDEQMVCPKIGSQKRVSLTYNCCFRNVLAWSYMHGIQATRWRHPL